MLRKLILLALVFIVTSNSYAQDLHHALELLKTNNRTDAYAMLQKINNEDKAYAALAKTVIEADNGHYLEAFHNFKEFTQYHPHPYPYLYALSSFGIFNNDECLYSSELRDFFKEVLNDPKANITIKSYAAERLATIEAVKGNIKSANEYYAQLQDVKNWSTVGVFDNTSGSGFNKDYGALQHPEASYVFTNKIGADVKWFSLGVGRNDRWWDMEYHYGISDAIIYAQTFVESDADCDVLLMAGSSGSMKIWVNDLLIASENEERNTDNDVYNYKVKLNKGFNRILLQVGSSEIERNNFMVRIADNEGQLLKLNSTETMQPYKKAQPYTIVQQPFFVETYFEEQLKNKPESLLDMLMLLNVYNHNDKKYQARKIAATLKAAAPTATVVSKCVVEALNRDVNTLNAAKELEAIKKIDPESNYGLLLRYEDATEKEEWDTAMAIVKKKIELYGTDAETEIKMLNLYVKKNEMKTVMEKLQEDLKKYPHEATFVLYNYYLQFSATKNLRLSNQILTDYLRRNFNTKIYDLVTENYFKIGDKQAGLNAYIKYIEDRPYATGKYADLAEVYYDLRAYDKALEWEQKAINLAPYVGRFYYAKGLIYNADAEKVEAKEMMKKAIYYTPTNYDARKKLRELEGKKELFSYLKQNNVAQIYKDALAKKAYNDEDAVYLLQDKAQVVHPENGAVEERHELVIQVLTQTGVNYFKEISIPFNSHNQRLVLDKTVLLKKDGSVVTAETKDNLLVFSTLEKGDALHILYRLENSYGGKLAEHFWEEFYINSGKSVQTARFSLMIPKERKFDYKVYNTTLKPEEKEVDNYKMYVWEKKDVPPVKPEPFMLPAADVAERIVVTSIPNWSYVANWYSDLSSLKAKADFEIQEQVKELLSGKENLTDVEKAKIIYAFIEHNYNYSNVSFLHSAFVPQRASRTLTAKLGDCKDLSTLFVAMAKVAGLDANLILVDTRDNGAFNLELPTIGFNHCIAQLHANNKNYLVELTNNNLPFGALPYSLLNANGLYIPKEGATTSTAALVKLNTNDRPANTLVRKSEINFNGNQTTVQRFSIRTGYDAGAMRASYKDVTEEQSIKDLTASLSSEFKKNVQIEYFKLKNLESLNDTMTLDYKFAIDNFTSDIVGMKVFKMPWADAFSLQEVVALDKRNYAIDLSSVYITPEVEETITLNVPTGKKLAEMPTNVSISCPSISYNLKYAMKNNKLVATREIKYLQDKVLPEDYASFKIFVNKMTESDSKQYGIK